ncbi:MAG: DUF4325 domain-containing protein [Candidatus Moraniibacteriota bacterium]|jgi:hypothetical protein
MKIELKKFGTTLLSRQAGREAFSAFRPSLENLPETENVEVDFSGVITFSPSWGDEFLRPLEEKFGQKTIFTNTQNPSVKVTLELLEEVNKTKFNIKN